VSEDLKMCSWLSLKKEQRAAAKMVEGGEASHR